MPAHGSYVLCHIRAEKTGLKPHKLSGLHVQHERGYDTVPVLRNAYGLPVLLNDFAYGEVDLRQRSLELPAVRGVLCSTERRVQELQERGVAKHDSPGQGRLPQLRLDAVGLGETASSQ